MNMEVAPNEQTVLGAIKDAFESENVQNQYNVLGYRIYLYFPDCKLAIEVDEFCHNDRNIDYEIQKVIEKDLVCKFIRINSDEKNFNFFKAINEIHRKISRSSKRFFIDQISKRLLKLEFKSDGNENRTHNHLVRKRTLNHLAKLSSQSSQII